MQLGWMQANTVDDLARTRSKLCETVQHADQLGLRYLHLPAECFLDVANLPSPKSAHLVMPLAAFEGDSPRRAVTKIRRVQDRLAGRLALRFCAKDTSALRTSYQILETLLSETAQVPRDAALTLPEPQPDVLMISQNSAADTIRDAAARGFHVVSPERQRPGDMARHWPRVVAGATHAKMRACPSRWHIARYIFISDRPCAIDTYRSNLARIGAGHGATSQLIAGTASEVSTALRRLRERIGPFGVLHCVDPGLDAATARAQRARFATEILPALLQPADQAQKEFERQ